MDIFEKSFYIVVEPSDENAPPYLSKVDRAILWKAYTNNEYSALNDKNLREWMLFCHYLEYIWSISLIQNGKIDQNALNLKKLEKKLKNII